MELFSLPQDKLLETLVPLPLSTIQSLMNSNSEIYRRIVEDEEFWEAKFKHDYPNLIESYERQLYFRFDNWKQIYIFQKNIWKSFRNLLDELMSMDTPIPEDYSDPEYVWSQKDAEKMPELIVYGRYGELIDITKYPYGSAYENYTIRSDETFETYSDEGELLSKGLPQVMEVFNKFPVYSMKLFRQQQPIVTLQLR